MKSQVLHTVWCNIAGEAAGEIWDWSLLGVGGLKGLLTSPQLPPPPPPPSFLLSHEWEDLPAPPTSHEWDNGWVNLNCILCKKKIGQTYHSSPRVHCNHWHFLAQASKAQMILMLLPLALPCPTNVKYAQGKEKTGSVAWWVGNDQHTTSGTDNKRDCCI